MNEMARQRIWLIAVLVLALGNMSQYVANRNLRAAVAQNRSHIAQLRTQIDERAQRVVAERLPRLRNDIAAAGQWLHSMYKWEGGLSRPEGLWIRGEPDFEGIGAWLFDVYLTARLNGASDQEAKDRVLAQIRESDEWRQKHPDAR